MLPPRVCDRCGTVIWAGQPTCPNCMVPKPPTTPAEG
jgi:RNA polymerase subunit RPABC4/transcription elongation factor Spt4